MTLIESLYAQGVRALREPRAAAADVLQLGFPKAALAPSLLLVCVLSVILDVALTAVLPEVTPRTTPFQTLFFYALTAVAFSMVVTVVGKWLGGVGKFEDSLLLIVFLQAMLLPASVLQLLIAIVSPQLAVFFMLAVAVFLIWIQVNFVAALHGFTLGRAFVVSLISSVAVALIASPFLVTEPMVVSDV